VYLFGEGAGRAETGEGRCKEREWGRKEGEGAEMGMH